MSRTARLRVVLVKPSKYNLDGYVERFRWGSMPNTTLPYLRSLTPDEHAGAKLEVHAVDEYVQTDLDYLDLLDARHGRTLVALVGVQSHQLHRALDLAALAAERGCQVVMGGPHPMTCDTSAARHRGVSFSLSEAELVWHDILSDAIERGDLDSTYGGERRWQPRIDPPPLVPPPRRDLRRYASRMLGIYPARGCPYRCSFCSIIKIAGHEVRSQPVETTLAGLRAAKAVGARAVFFASDNFNKYAEAAELLEAMIAADLRLPFFVQCDVQVYRQPDLVELLGRAGCFNMFVGAESFDRATLKSANKVQNHPSRYRDIVELCRSQGIATTFANILGFPQDTRERILDNLALLRDIGPEMAAFYLLTPIPGTEQYADFLARGLISEPNMDRFDASTLTWRHPSLSDRELRDLIFRCYREFFAFPDACRKGLRATLRARRATRSTLLVAVLAHSLLSGLSARRPGGREASMAFSAGIGRRRLDHVRDHLPRRVRRYGFELAPLPENLTLSAHDEELNQGAKLRFAEGPLRLAVS
jgi:radical SAM superfamily enzyme YgiQ (UPF0313 family)